MFLMLLVCILPPAALEKAGIGDRLAIRPEDGEDLLKNILLDESQKKNVGFVPGHYEALDAFAKTTDAPIVFIGVGCPG